MKFRIAKIGLFAVATGAITLVIGGLVGVLVYFAYYADEAGRAQEQAQVANGLNVRIDEAANDADEYVHTGVVTSDIAVAMIIGPHGPRDVRGAQPNLR